MGNDKELRIEVGEVGEKTISFKVGEDDKKLYEELRVIYKVKNLPELCRSRISRLLHEVAQEVKSNKAG